MHTKEEKFTKMPKIVMCFQCLDGHDGEQIESQPSKVNNHSLNDYQYK